MAQEEEVEAARAARATKKLRVYGEDRLPAAPSTEAIVGALYGIARRLRPEPPGVCQDEGIQVVAATPAPGGWRVDVRYVFDRDFASQYDKTEAETWEVLWAPATGAHLLQRRPDPTQP